jgi:hypothetical protein
MHQILFHRNPLGDKFDNFGKRPVVGIQLQLFHGQEKVFEDDHPDVSWYENTPTLEPEPKSIKGDTTKAGYQYVPPYNPKCVLINRVT